MKKNSNKILIMTEKEKQEFKQQKFVGFVKNLLKM